MLIKEVIIKSCNQPKDKEAINATQSNIVLINDSMQRLTLKQTQKDFSKGNRKVWLQLFAWLQLVGLLHPHFNISKLFQTREVHSVMLNVSNAAVNSL